MNQSFFKIGKTLLSLFFFFLILCCFSCRETIDLVPKKELLTGISIQGKLAKGNPSIASVNIERVFTYSGESRKTLPITAVSILDSEGNEFFLSKNRTVSDFIGYIYSGETSLDINYGQDYRCRVILGDGVIYESTFETLSPVPKIEGLEFEVFEKDIRNTLGKFELAKFARFRVNTPLITDNNFNKSYLRWTLMRNWKPGPDPTGHPTSCVFTESPDFSHISVLDGNSVAGNQLKRFNFYEEYINFPFGNTYYLNVTQESLSEEAYHYWKEVKELTQRDGNRFEATLGIVRTNFKNLTNPEDKVFGFFYVTAQNEKYIRVCPNDLGFDPGVSSGNCSLDGTQPSYWQDCK